MTLYYEWSNSVKIKFGKNVVQDYLGEYIKPSSKILCTFGFGSIEKNGCKSDVVAALEKLKCTVQWEGGLQANPDVSRCVEIAAAVKKFNPDLILAVGGGSVLDATKFIALAAKLPEGKDPWNMMLGTLEPPSCAYPIGSVLTLSATGSEWNHAFVISKRETQEKMALTTPVTYPLFSLVDPTYQLTLPLRQLRNGVYDAMIHVIDATFVPTVLPLLDDFQLCVLKELIEIGPKVIQSNPSYEFVNRLALAASFACNFLYRSPVKATCFGIHCIGHMLTAKYGIDHGATLSIITCPLLQEFLNERKAILAKAAETIWNATGTTEQKAQACIDNLRKFIAEIGQPLKCSDVEGVVVQEGDVDIITKMVFKSTKGNNLGVNGTITEEITRKILSQVVK